MKSHHSRIAALCLAGCTVAHADVTVTTQTAGKAAFINIGGEGANLIKGNRMRTDATMGSRANSLIIDIDGLRFVDVDDRKKSATVTPLAAISDDLAKVGLGAISTSLKKTAQVKKVAGYSCTVHDVNVTMPFSVTGNPGDGMDVTMVLSGTACLSADAPGLADYQKFYKASADSGFIFGDPRAVKSPTGAAQARAYAEFTRKMADAGMMLESHLTISASGNNPMASMMAKAAASDITTTVTQISVGDLPADKFDVPAGYKVKTQK